MKLLQLLPSHTSLVSGLRNSLNDPPKCYSTPELGRGEAAQAGEQVLS